MPPARPFACSACSRTFTRSENLERHKKTHHGGANAPSFACPKCRSRFSRRDVCKRHTLNCKESEPEVTPPRPVRVHPPPASAVVQEEQESRVETGSLDLSKVDLQSASSSPVEFQHDASASRPSPFLPADIIKKHIDLYFEEFHPSLPILHRATTTLASTPTIMLKILMSISSMYLRRPGTNMFEENRKSSHDLWASGGSELEVFVLEDRQRLRMPWVLQSWILCIVYGTFAGDEQDITKARKMYRFMTDVVRDLQLLHQRSMIPPASLWSADIDLTTIQGDATIRQKWQTFINQESLKASMYALYYLDYHLFVSSNIRPMLSSFEFEWEFPVSSSLWEAETPNEWWLCLQQNVFDLQISSSSVISDSNLDFQMRSLLAASQALLSNCPSPRLMSALASSPFATLCVVTNLDCLVRDFTHCYYQLPPTLSDPSPFHVLTQRQNAQIATALSLIWSIMRDGPCASCSRDCKSLWHAVRIACLSLKISLSKPDDLLVGAIVESSPTAGLATATHLTLGNYVTARRSVMSWQKKSVGDDGFLAILDELMKGLHEMASPQKSPSWEGPWVFIQGFRMLLTLWRALRLSISELQTHDLDQQQSLNTTRYPRFTSPSKTIVDAVAGAIQLYNSPHVRDLGPTHDDVENWESEYMRCMQMICHRRDVWGIGQSMTNVLEEISAMSSA